MPLGGLTVTTSVPVSIYAPLSCIDLDVPSAVIVPKKVDRMAGSQGGERKYDKDLNHTYKRTRVMRARSWGPSKRPPTHSHARLSIVSSALALGRPVSLSDNLDFACF